MTALLIRFLGRPLRVECDRATARWLAEFLGACFELAPADDASRARLALRLVVDAARYRELRREFAAGPTQPTPCFRLERGVVALPGRRRPGSSLLFDEKFDCFYRTGDAAVEVVGRPGEPGYRTGAMRVIRELLVEADREPATDLELHAAAFERDGVALVVAGPKRSGKTSALLRALSSSSAKLVANDRLLLRVEPDAIRVRGLPTSWSVRPDTAAAHPELLRAVPRVASAARLTRAEARAALLRAGPAKPEAPPRLSAAQVLEAFGAGASAEAPLGALVVLGADAPGRPRPADAAALRGCLYAGGSPEAPTLFGRLAREGAPPSAPGPPARLLAALAPFSLSGNEAQARFRPCFDPS